MHRIDPHTHRAIAHRRRFRVDPDRAFGGAVGWMPACAPDKAHDRADVDDRSPAGLRHLLGGKLGAEENAGLVYRDDALPAVQPVRIADRTAGNPGVVHKDVEPTIARQGLRNEGNPFRFAGHVDRRCNSLPAPRANISCDRPGLVPEDIGNDDPGAFRREEPRFRLAHPVGTAGYYGDFAFESHGPLLIKPFAALY